MPAADCFNKIFLKGNIRNFNFYLSRVTMVHSENLNKSSVVLLSYGNNVLFLIVKKRGRGTCGQEVLQSLFFWCNMI